MAAEAWFDDVEKGRGGVETVRVQVRLTPDRLAKVDRLARKTGRSRSAVLRWLLDRVVEDV